MADLTGHNGGPAMREGGEGWVAIHRSIRNHWLVGFGQPVKPHDPSRGALSRAEAWIDLTMECQWKGGFVSNAGRKMWLEPGQLLGGVSWLANRWNWSPQTVRTFLDKLEEDIMIGRIAPGVENNMQKGKQTTVITVCNYSEYQIVRPEPEQAKQHANNEHPTRTQHASNNIYKDNTLTLVQEESPPTPSGGVPSGDAAKLAKRAQRAAEKAEHAKANQALLQEALDVYQKAADYFGFAPCETFTPARQTRLLDRLEAIGGVEHFRVALRALAIESDLTDFLRGKIKPRRPGEKPFRLDFDTLLQEKGSLGDVLGRLYDLGKAHADKLPGARKQPWLEWTESEWETQIKQHANGTWPVAKIGPWPTHAECAAPRQVLERLGLATAYDDNGIKRGG
jgi:DNA-binding Lrp family transcriptional regulator